MLLSPLSHTSSVFTGQSSSAVTNTVLVSYLFICILFLAGDSLELQLFIKHVFCICLPARLLSVHMSTQYVSVRRGHRKLKMTVNEGLIPLGTEQNPIPSTKISSFQLSYLSYLFIFSQPGLTPSLFSSLSLSRRSLFCTLIYFFLYCSHRWRHVSLPLTLTDSTQVAYGKAALFLFLFFWSDVVPVMRGLIGKPNLLRFLWARGDATHAD